MHLTLTNTIRGLFTFGSPKKPESTDHSYEYIRGPIEERGPCPGLNALANQGYLPRDGKNLTPALVSTALRTALHMSHPLATSLSNSLKPILRKDGTFDLPSMRAHNIIEHDRSITRLDYSAPNNPTHDNFTFQPAMFEAFLADAGPGEEGITLKSLAKTYVRRKKESKKDGGKLGLGLWFVNVLQTVSLLNTAGKGGELERGLVKTFYEEERFPDLVVEDERTRTLLGLLGKGVLLLWHVVFA
ncbi:Cloroperoxidase [Hyaloscypha variabilis F]|uniref:Cloroperoxidase n=1 Tax=Hyaloscypha variabilis (strain UAMH 11265 / GT02V1 / F) TaxID=1149755 RepID=A0A2J6QUI2_HYAVF|nr:Cloroperoxidase [Hyaloscypha variabilis F]